MSKQKIIFFSMKNYEIPFFEYTNKKFNYEMKYLDFGLTEETANSTKGYDVVCLMANDLLSKNIIDIFHQNEIKLIALRSAGYNNIDLKPIWGKIHVARVPAYSPNSVAEHAVTLMLALNRKVHKAYNRTRENNFSIDGLMGFDMFQKTAGIIGAGRIAKVLITILKGFGMKILVYDKIQDEEYAKKTDIKYVDLKTLYKDSDIISLHCPLTPETVHIINEEAISLMKDHVMIINTGRGKLIDSKALIGGLKNAKIASAGLDVYEEEEHYFFEDLSNSFIDDDVLARLLSFPNVIVTAHQAFFTKEALKNIADVTLENVNEFFTRKTLANEICYQCESATCPKTKEKMCF